MRLITFIGTAEEFNLVADRLMLAETAVITDEPVADAPKASKTKASKTKAAPAAEEPKASPAAEEPKAEAEEPKSEAEEPKAEAEEPKAEAEEPKADRVAVTKIAQMQIKAGKTTADQVKALISGVPGNPANLAACNPEQLQTVFDLLKDL